MPKGEKKEKSGKAHKSSKPEKKEKSSLPRKSLSKGGTVRSLLSRSRNSDASLDDDTSSQGGLTFSRKESKLITTLRKTSRKLGYSFDESEIKQIWGLLFHAGHDHLALGEKGKHHSHDESEFLVDSSRFSNIFEHRLGQRSQCERFFATFFKDDLLKNEGKGVNSTDFFSGMGVLKHYSELMVGGRDRALPSRERVLNVFFSSYDDDGQGIMRQSQIKLLESHFVFVFQSKNTSSTRSQAEDYVQALVNEFITESGSGSRILELKKFVDLSHSRVQDLLACCIPNPLFVFDVSEAFSLFARDPNAPPLTEETRALLGSLKNLATHDEETLKSHSEATEEKEDSVAHGSLIIDVLKLIRDEKTDLTAIDASGNTACHYAVRCSSTDILKELLLRGSTQLVFQRGPSGVTAVHAAASSGALNSVRIIHAQITSLSEPEKGIALQEFMTVQDDAGYSPLHRAIHMMGAYRHGQRQNSKIISCITELLTLGVEVTSLDSDACTMIHVAARSGNSDALEAIFKHPVLADEQRTADLLDMRSNGGLTALHWAANNGHAKCCEVLVSRGSDVAATNMAEQTPVHLAARGGNFMCIESMLGKEEADSHEAFVKQDSTLETPLHMAARANEMLTVQYLIKNGPDALKVKNSAQRTPTELARKLGKSHAAIASTLADGPLKELSAFSRNILAKFRAGDSKAVLKMLKDPNADVLASNENGTTLLQYAAMRGRNDIAIELLARGSDPNWPNNRGTRPVHKCLQYGTLDVLKSLLAQKNVRVDVTDDEGMTAVHRGMRELNATLSKDNDKKRGTPKGIRECLEFMYASKVDLGIRDDSGMSVLDLAASFGFVDQIHHIVKHDAEVNASNPNNGETALHHALRASHTECVTALIDAGIDVTKGDALRICAAQTYNLQHADLLTQRIAQSQLEKSPIVHWAVQGGNIDMIRWAIEKFPAQLLLADSEGSIPLHYATNVEVIDLLFGSSLTNVDIDERRSGSSLTNVEVVTSLITGDQLNAKNSKNHSPIQQMIQSHCVGPEVIEKMLAKGASLELSDLYLAAAAGHTTMCVFLQQKGLNYFHEEDQDENADGASPEAAIRLLKFVSVEEDDVPTPFPVLRSGPVEKIIRHAANRRYFDEDFVRALLLTFRQFVTCEALFGELVKLVDRAEESVTTPGPLAVILFWLQNRFEDFIVTQQGSDGKPYRLGDTLLATFGSAISDAASQPLTEEYKHQIRDLCNHDLAAKDDGDSDSSIERSMTDSEDGIRTAERSQQALLLHSATSWARALSHLDSKVARRVDATEFLGQAWTKGDEAAKLAPRLTAVINRFNYISKWVKRELLAGKNGSVMASSPEFLPNSPKFRAKMIGKFIDIAHECAKLNNFSSAIAICSALDNSAVSRLSKTWDVVPSKAGDKLAPLRDLMSPLGNFKQYRAALVSAAEDKRARVPFLAPALQDLTFCDEGNELFIWKDKAAPERHMEFVVNFEKCAMEGRIMYDSFLSHVAPTVPHFHGMHSAPLELQELSDQLPLGFDEDEEYARSLKLEPRA